VVPELWELLIHFGSEVVHTVVRALKEFRKRKANYRFNDVMARLSEEQQARLATLKARYGKGEDADSKRERLEEEHRRRMMGFYTKSGREQERKRYEEALKKLTYQEEERALLEDFRVERAAIEESINKQ